MSETILTAIKSLIMAAFVTTFGIYTSAAFIALIAAITRIAYTSDKASLKLFGRFFIMSLAITMMMVHIGQLQGWSNDMTIIVSGITAFLCREVLESVAKSKDIIVNRVMGMFK